MAIPTSRERVPTSTASHINQRIRSETEHRLRQSVDSPALIDRHLVRLKEEWDIERTLEANASALTFVGVLLGFFVHPYWLLLPALVALFLFQHAVQGWCPPMPVLRRLGFRTAYEIETERQALKALRGDFRGVGQAADPAGAAYRAAEA